MSLTSTDITALSRLLDEGLALPQVEREAWLAGLPESEQHLTQPLREMLEKASGQGGDPSLLTLPKLGRDESVAHPDDLVGPYRLLREIGRGGMGTVWLAARADGSFKREVALKLPRLAWAEGLAQRMARERDIGALLEHPSIARLYDAGLDEHGRPYMALEYIDGQPIDAWCKAKGLNVPQKLRLFVQVVRAVAYAHGKLVVHRDLKPSNVLVTPDGQTHLLDFGIAKLMLDERGGAPGALDDATLTQAGDRAMTPRYASPEQIAGEPVTVASDVYSLGVLLYELLTGQPPLAPRRATLGAVEDAILAGSAPLASSRVTDKTSVRMLRGEVDAILAKAMKRRPAERYISADALAQDIERHLSGETVSARPDGTLYRLRRTVWRHRVAFGATGVVLLAVLAGSGVAVVQAQRAARSAEREREVKAFVTDVFKVSARVDPKNAGLRPASNQALIENGAQLIQQRFAGQPDLQAELYGVVGGVFSDMGAYRLAVDYSTRRVEALATQRASTAEQAKAILNLGQTLFEDQRFADAELRARRALGLSIGDDAAQTDALVLLGRIEAAQARGGALQATLREIESRLATTGSRPSAQRAWALALQAMVLNWQNRFDEAIPLLQQAADIGTASEGRLSRTAIEIHLYLASQLAQTVESKLAQRHFDMAAGALRQLGGANEVRAAYEASWFAWVRYSAAHQVKTSEAISTLESSRVELAASSFPVPASFLVQIDFWSGCILTSSGDFNSGWPRLEAALPVVEKAAATLRAQWDVAACAANAEMHSGRHDLAASSLRERMEIRRQRGLGNHPFAAWDYVVIARNFRMQGQLTEAAKELDSAPHFDALRGPGYDPDAPKKAIRWEHAAIQLASNSPRSALETLLQTSPGINADVRGGDEEDYDDLLGEVLCATGQSRRGLEVLQKRLIASETNDDYPYAPWRARLRAVAGLCGAAIGDRALATRYAAQARAAFIAQPDVSPYYKAPLSKLERALGKGSSG